MKIVDILSHRVIAVNPVFMKLGLTSSATIFLSQALYWSKISKFDWFYKTCEEWQLETFLGKRAIENSRERLREMGILIEEKRGMPAQLFYKIDADCLEKLLSELDDNAHESPSFDLQKGKTRLPQKGTTVFPKGENKTSQKGKPYYIHRLHTEITTHKEKIYKKEIFDVFDFWKNATKHDKAKLDNSRRIKIEARLREGFTTDDLKKAVAGCMRTPFNCGHNAEGKIYDSIDLIFRNAEKVESFMRNYDQPPILKTRGTLESEKFYFEALVDSSNTSLNEQNGTNFKLSTDK